MWSADAERGCGARVGLEPDLEPRNGFYRFHAEGGCGTVGVRPLKGRLLMQAVYGVESIFVNLTKKERGVYSNRPLLTKFGNPG